jgi:hypothetical protein
MFNTIFYKKKKFLFNFFLYDFINSNNLKNLIFIDIYFFYKKKYFFRIFVLMIAQMDILKMESFAIYVIIIVVIVVCRQVIVQVVLTQKCCSLFK